MGVSVDSSVGFSGTLAEDPSGRLYDRRTREQLGRSPHFADERQRTAAETIRALDVTVRAIRRVRERWAQRYGLSEVRLQMITLIRYHPAEQLTLGQLARALDLSPRTVTSLVDLLERDGLVTRQPKEGDRRAIQVRLTEAGRSLVDSVSARVFRRSSPLFEGISDDEMHQLRDLTYRLLVNVSRSEG